MPRLLMSLATACSIALLVGCSGEAGSSSSSQPRTESSHGVTVTFPSDWQSVDGIDDLPDSITSRFDWIQAFGEADHSTGFAVMTGNGPLVATDRSVAAISAAITTPTGASLGATHVDGLPALSVQGHLAGGRELQGMLVYDLTAAFGIICIWRDDSAGDKERCDSVLASFNVDPIGDPMASWSQLESPRHSLTLSVPPGWTPQDADSVGAGDAIVAELAAQGTQVSTIIATAERADGTLPLYVSALVGQMERTYNVTLDRRERLDHSIGRGFRLVLSSDTSGIAVYVIRQGRTMVSMVHPYDDAHADDEAALRPTYDAIAATMKAAD